jgi:hypothetical protein
MSTPAAMRAAKCGRMLAGNAVREAENLGRILQRLVFFRRTSAATDDK